MCQKITYAEWHTLVGETDGLRKKLIFQLCFFCMYQKITYAEWYTLLGGTDGLQKEH